MKSTSKQLEFISLKADGKSNAQIARMLHISESTASRYTRLLEDKISQYKAERLQELYDAFLMTREARIKCLGTTLSQIEDALKQTTLSIAAPEKLLEMKLKYLNALKAEYIPLRFGTGKLPDAGENTARSAVLDLLKLLEGMRSGDLSPIQVETEVKLIVTMLKALEAVEFEKRLDEVERLANKGRLL